MNISCLILATLIGYMQMFLSRVHMRSYATGDTVVVLLRI